MDSTMANEPATPPSALFAPDGTELPAPPPVLLDPLTGPDPDTWWDPPDLPISALFP